MLRNKSSMNALDVNIYQVYYDDDQSDSMFLDTIPLLNPELSQYFENDIILRLYDEGKVSGDYFGVLSWKARHKNRIRSRSITNLLNNKYDLFSLTYDRHDVLGYANLCHPKFAEIFIDLLHHLNIDPDIKPLVGLYQNAVIARPGIYTDYIENFLQPALRFFEDSPQEYKRKLYSDAMYKGVSEDILEDTLGVSHYPYHTFVLERLWSVYFELNRNKKNLRYKLLHTNRFSHLARKVDSKGKLHKIIL